MSGYYNLQYGAYTFTGLTMQPPTRDIDASEQLIESWRFRKLISATTMQALDTAIDVIKEALRLHDQTVVITRNSNTVLTTASNAGYNTRASVRKIGQQNDLQVTQEIEVSISFTIPMTQTSSDVWAQSYAGRKAVSVRVGFSPARRRTITISCVYTMTPGVSAKTAKENYDSLHAAWTAAILAKATVGGNMQDRLNAGAAAGNYHVILDDVSDMNRIDAEIRATTVYQELLYDDDDSSSGTPKKNEALTDATWGFARIHGRRMGRSTWQYGPTPRDQPITVQARYSAHVSWAVLNSGNKWGLHEIFAQYIRDIMVSRTRTQLDLPANSWVVIVGEIGFDPTPSNRTISARLNLTFVRRGPTLTGPGSGGGAGLWLEFDEEISMEINANNQYRKILDEEEDHYDVYTPGRLVRLTVTQTALTFSAEAPEPPRLARPWVFDGLNKRSKRFNDDTQDVRAANDFTATFQNQVFLTVYTTRYTLVVGGTGGSGNKLTAPLGGELLYQ